MSSTSIRRGLRRGYHQIRYNRRRQILLTLSILAIFSLSLLSRRRAAAISINEPWDHWNEEQASTRKVQVFLPVDKKKAEKDTAFCRDLWSAVEGGYTVNVYNWELDKPRALETHKPKITSLAKILSTPDLLTQLNVSSNDLIFLVDGIDVILQLPPSTLKDRYDKIAGDVIAAGSFNCWPNAFDSVRSLPAPVKRILPILTSLIQEDCLEVPRSRLPTDLFWDAGLFALFKLSMSRTPDHVNSGLVIGSVKGMATVLEKLVQITKSPTYRWEYDQEPGAFNIALRNGDLQADNDYSLFWCAEHVYDSLAVLPPNHQKLSIDPPHHPDMSHDSFPKRPVVIDQRTGVVPIALHFNGLEPKVGYDRIWEEMYHHPLDISSKQVQWVMSRPVKMILDNTVEIETVGQICGEQLGLR
ncbi:uncharacterized protein I206_100577 [Kwoniella pini CBS 10737]|uniref:Uncharacterized protein n=1 Tax=Kwoniella pini CBS 10737 TaxID=1296096 RepID=A0A1B9ICS4_9TREE|nr:uncharacterized protein I206_00748 [Kwoniella pini CBS 10737]OCF53445.1 hypothetical protein I206_00748 [Kwoniella pini CBS 10737]